MKFTRYLLTVLIVLVSVLLSACGEQAPISTSAPELSDPTSYLNPDLAPAERAADLLARMTLAEKVGQMTQVEKDSIEVRDIARLGIGSLLNGGGGSPENNNPAAWLDMVNGFQEQALKSRLGIPMIYGVDAIHGPAAVKGATIFPHNIGLGATRDPDLVRRIGQATAAETSATGIRWNFGPVVAVPQDIRWGRTYEGFSEDTVLVKALATAKMQGMQNVDGVPDLAARSTILATPKHYLADGGTEFGSSTQEIIKPYLLDQGDARIDEATLRSVHLPPYEAAIEAGARSIMVSFSSWNGLKMHANDYLLNDVLKGELGFDGILLSDWQGVDQISDDYYEAVVTAINAGIDMVMVPYDYHLFIDTLTKAVERGDVPEERINDAVRRILTVKFELGLFEQPLLDDSGLEVVGSDEHRALAREAVSKSLVLLKNEAGTLPLEKETPLIYVAGEAADDIGIQSGGWTTQWQGEEGEIMAGTSILKGLEELAGSDTKVGYSSTGNFGGKTADVGIAVIGERPYAEGVGDSVDLAIPAADIAAVKKLQDQAEKLVLIIVTGRPVIITNLLPLADAVVVAWLPGTEGQGVADVLFGDYPFSGTLPYSWPRSVEQLPFAFATLPGDGPDAPLFPFGFGLSDK